MNVIIFLALVILIVFMVTNKEKMEKLFEEIEVMKCPVCGKEYRDLNLKRCKVCNDSYLLYNTRKKVISKKITDIFTKIIIVVVMFSIIGIGLYWIISSNIKEKRRIEKYNNDLSSCYAVIKEESNWNKFQSILDEHTEETDFSSKAYRMLYQAVDERIENIKNGNDDGNLVFMLEDIKEQEKNNQEIEERYVKADLYSKINKSNKYIEEEKYKEAYDLLTTIINDNEDKNQDIVNIATNKQNEIKDKAFEQIIAQAQEKINAQDYSSAQTLLYTYKDLGNQTILDMYNNATNEVNRIEAERKAKEEAERKARIEKERFDYEVYCYFNLIAWKDKSLNDNQAFSKCARKFGITKEKAQQSYEEVNNRGGWWYQDEYPDIFEKYQKQY